MDLDLLIESLAPVLAFFGEQPLARAGAVLVLGILLATLSGLISTQLMHRVAARTRNHLDEQMLLILRRPLFWSIILLSVLLAVRILGSEALLQTGKSVAGSLLILMWSVFILRMSRLLLDAMARHGDGVSLVSKQTLPLFNNLVLILVVGLSVYLLFSVWHIDMTAWLASAGIIGIAVGFAAKDTLANLFSGVFILADAPYKIGDYVVLESGERGKITHIGIRSTRLLTRDDVQVTIPNAIMGNTRIVNESGGPYEKFRIRVKVGVAYGSDIDKVRDVLMDVAAKEPSVCMEPEPRVRFRAFGTSSLDFELLCWVEQPELRGRVLDALNCAVYKRFQLEHIRIPFPQQDIYVKEWPGRD